MTHIAQQRIKKGGKVYLPNDPIELTEDELAELPEGAVTEGNVADEPVEPSPLDNAQQAQLKDAVAKLKATAFKQDGEIRAGALKGLNDQLDFAVGVEDVTAAQATGSE
ncbi:hypothetical protein [Planktotalea sp.]|uniref:hypothetical protein n=1 Tax=Planktotalea sp. TaxID=2029877 RepID=UPI003D6C3513